MRTEEAIQIKTDTGWSRKNTIKTMDSFFCQEIGPQPPSPSPNQCFSEIGWQSQFSKKKQH